MWRCVTISKNKELLINEQIRDKEVRLIGADGEQVGIVSIEEAMRIAGEKNLDLVKIAPQSVPPVCRVMDYGKHQFEQSKKEKEARKNQKVISTKEVRLSIKIDTHDFETKARNAIKFLGNGDKVKVSIRFRGREAAHPQLAINIMNEFAEACAEYSNVISKPKIDGRNTFMMLEPKEQ